MATVSIPQNFPKQIPLPDMRQVTLRLMEPADKGRVLRFAAQLAEDDLLFLRIDITNPAVVDGWIQNIKRGNTVTLLAEVGEDLAGYASVHRDPARWTRRVGEIRINVLPAYRGVGLGRALTSEIFELGKALRLTKLAAMMTPDQRGARTAFERLGFTVEALLSGYVDDRRGQPRDLLVMSYDLTGFTDQAPNP